VLDVNEFAPAFSAESYALSVAENSVAGTVVGQLAASDRDGSDLPLLMTIMPQTQNNGSSSKPPPLPFDLDPLTGALTVRGGSVSLDREAVGEYRFAVEVTDSGAVPQQRVGHASVVVTLVDANDVRPVVLPAGAAVAGEPPTGLPHRVTFVEEGAPVQLAGNLTVVDPDLDKTAFAGATARLASNPDGAAERLFIAAADLIDLPPGLLLLGNASATVTLRGPAPLSALVAALRLLRYVSTADEPSPPALRTVLFSVDDGVGAGAEAPVAVDIQPVNDAPLLLIGEGSGGDLGLNRRITYTEGGPPVLLLDPAAHSLTDDDSPRLLTATASLVGAGGGGVSPDDVLAVDVAASGIVATFAAGTLRMVAPPGGGRWRRLPGCWPR